MSSFHDSGRGHRSGKGGMALVYGAILAGLVWAAIIWGIAQFT